MSDNRTTELREKLTERGVDWTKPKSAAEFIQTTFLRDGWGIEVLERNIGLCVTATNVFDTPEQAIAATLGSELNPDGLPNGLTISDDSTLLNWCGENYVKQSTLGSGTLTAEQVRKCVRVGACDHGLWGALDEDTDWQAIADELNAELGSGECELVYGENDYGDDGWWCQSCGEWFAASFRHTGRNNIIKPSYCQHCGKVVNA